MKRKRRKTDHIVKAVRTTQIVAAGLTAVAVTLTLVISFNEADQMDKAQRVEESFRRAAENATGAYHDDTHSDRNDSLDDMVYEVTQTVTEWPVVSPEEFKETGIVQTENWLYTWYSENVLPGEGLNIPGRHVDEFGFVCDCDDYLCVACNDIPQGYPIDTPFGVGKVYDTILDADGNQVTGVIDIYVNW